MIEYALKIIMKNGMEGIVKEDNIKNKQVRFYNGRIGIIKEWDDKTMNIFMAKGSKTVSIELDNPSKRKIEETIEKNKKLMKLLSSSEFYGIEKNKKYKNNKIFDKDVLKNEKMISIAEESINYGGKAGIVFSSLNKTIIANTNGIMEKDKNSLCYLSVRSFYKNSSCHEVSCSRSIKNVDAGATSVAHEMAKKGIKAKKGKEGRYNVIFSPLAFANLISNVATFYSAFYVDAGYSFLTEKIGEKVASEKISIYDSGIAEDGMASSKFDDEGIATQKTTIIKNGILKNYIHNSTTAHKYKTRSTGNAGIVAPQPWNTIVLHGNSNFDEMVDEIKEGILITNLWYTRFHNYRAGDFSSVARDVAFYIKNGEMIPIKNIRVSDNMERILKNVEMLSKETKQIFWWEVENPVFTPYAMVRDVRITTS